MSLASYIGCNVEIPLTEPDSNDVIVFGRCFADESMLEIVQEYQFQKNYIYEVSTSWGIELVEWQNVKEKKEAKEKLLTLCKIMEGYSEDGDYFELFSCWVGDEDKERVGELKLKINHFNIDELCIPERTLVRIEK
ncbi:hypothetical protein BK767_16035 [Bacillus thuringiensis serovar kyushuensis]|uniref:hypothetical protein n=2 Tax=Bacillus thuringiensis TaxID=1428 RepID=UPI000B436384|nr:hypothetical protein [Bacillus thuringiensis]MEC2862255.1 hypothetical protein [Bacillus cereus]OTZ66887.1 hypothetical protein BK768_25915 [Bacillus thuringiensis serovar tohokuensis]OTZ71571.1 hypothetical protein BK767_16035 [Bacillus thuringiensis serovar kyushuensis]OUB86348.1 hypothetical protein BK773_21115 [Bacillus thuringiensis serovar indiana]